VPFRVLLREYRSHRMARFFVWVVAYGGALWLVERLTGEVPGPLRVVFWLAFLIGLGYYVGRLVGFIRGRLLWHLRRRLVVTYVFIAVIPIFLILLLVAIGALIINAQFAAFLVALNVRERVSQLQQLSRGVAHDVYLTREPTPEVLLDRLHTLFVAELGTHSAKYPALEVTLRLGEHARAFDLAGRPVAPPVAIPSWLASDEFAAVVIDEGRVVLRSVAQGKTPHGQFALVLSEPISSELLDQIGEGIGPVGVGVLAPEARNAQGTPGTSSLDLDDQNRLARESTVMSKNVPVPAPMFFGDYTVFGALTLDPIIWGGEREERLAEPVFLYVTSRLMTLESKLLSTLGRFSRIYAIAFVAVAAVFLVLELLAFLVGVRLTKSITRTVDELYGATERVRAGDFSHRINLPARDQLTALGEAFDSMTASVERLLRESQEKSRMQSELDIAREVQRQLFPRTLPRVPGLELFGFCNPARSVSGDYYDFIQIDSNRVGLVLGDISGKGISAALLMAAIQSSLRAQFYDGMSRQGLDLAVPLSTAEVVKRLNHQLYESTSTEKYATFFYAVYDAATRTLTYTNAGHLPPVLYRRDRTERLCAGGTVVGLFSPVEYAQATVRLEPGDTLLAFTDGLTEPENIFGEEFGEERLLAATARGLSNPLDKLAGEIYAAVMEWTGSPELQDDMTLIVARAAGGENQPLAESSGNR
jgi:sigma-B regulation protein RsbU (phosphoserine phosphatase)